MALQQYHDAFGCFPPAYVADENARPMHSWRVLILPFVDQQELYKRYRFDEPWDGPNNRKLHDVIVPLYSCPSEPKRGSATSYVVVTGPETAWRGGTSLSLGDIRDGTSQTISVAEVASGSVHWMEPRDLEFDRMSFTIDSSDKAVGLESHHPGGANVLMADGSVHWLAAKTARRSLRALLTASGGDDVGELP